ncbi:MAG: hypothetical protein FD130_1969, partial [Halothiobacillaceae bacterium]
MALRLSIFGVVSRQSHNGLPTQSGGFCFNAQ